MKFKIQKTKFEGRSKDKVWTNRRQESEAGSRKAGKDEEKKELRTSGKLGRDG